MGTNHLDVAGGTIAFDDTGGGGPLVVLLPGAGDIRSEYRFVVEGIRETGARVVAVDLRGHGESSAEWNTFGVAESAADLIAVLDHLDAGPATIVATSFAPAAALWAAADRPELIAKLVLISAHLEAAPAWQRLPLQLMLMGPIAGRLWAGQFKKWHPAAPPSDLDAHAGALATMMRDPQRRRAVRDTLTAHRDGLAEKLTKVQVPTLVVMGGADSHFKDPADEGASIAEETGGEVVVIPGAGHYPHVEFPDQVVAAMGDLLALPLA